LLVVFVINCEYKERHGKASALLHRQVVGNFVEHFSYAAARICDSRTSSTREAASGLYCKCMNTRQFGWTVLDMTMLGSKPCCAHITITAWIKTSYSERILLLISIYNLQNISTAEELCLCHTKALIWCTGVVVAEC